MNRIVKTLLFTLMIIVLQVSFFNNISIGNQTANILLMYVVYIAQKEGKYSGVAIGLVLGLLYDTLLSNSIGIRAVSFITVGYAIGIVSEYLFLENTIILSIFAIMATILNKFILNLIYFFQSYNITIGSVLGKTFNFEIILNIGVIILIFYLERRLKFYELFDIKGVEGFE